MKISLLRSFGLLVGGLVVVCCSGSDLAEPALGRIPVVTDTHELVLPLDAYHYSESEYLKVQSAAWRLVGDCVERFGGDYTVPEALVVADVGSPFLFGNERRYGLFDAKSAASHGYKVPPERLQSGGEGEWSPSDDELVLVRGSSGSSRPTDANGQLLPIDGCSGEADRILLEGAPDLPVDFGFPNTLANESHERSEADSRLREVIDQWSECMRRSGYDYSSIWEPNNQDWPTPVGEAEIAVATADVTCKEEVNLLGVWFAVETAYQRGAIQQNVVELNILRSKISTEATNAAQVLDGD